MALANGGMAPSKVQTNYALLQGIGHLSNLSTCIAILAIQGSLPNQNRPGRSGAVPLTARLPAFPQSHDTSNNCKVAMRDSNAKLRPKLTEKHTAC